jgi:DNA-binding LytR/AlgR family response regulator
VGIDEKSAFVFGVMMIEIAICDDDSAITASIAAILRRNAGIMPKPLHIQKFSTGRALIKALPFDIIFLDIELGDTTGILAAEEIRNRCADLTLVFVSAHESYCKELFRFDTTAFLSKPIDEKEVQELLSRLSQKFSLPRKIFSYRVKENMRRIPLADILYFESKARLVTIVAREKQEVFYGKLDEVAKDINSPNFVRIHKSFLVNLDNIERFENNSLIINSGHILPIAQRKQREIRRIIMDYYVHKT